MAGMTLVLFAPHAPPAPRFPRHARSAEQPAAVPAAAARAARGDREARARAGRRAARRSASSPPNWRSRASRCARRSTGWSRKACWCAARARATSSAARIEKNFAKLTSFSEDMRARGRTPRSVWLSAREGTRHARRGADAGAQPRPPVYRFHRLRFADDAPMALEYATIVGALPAVAGRGRRLAVRRARARRQPPGARAAAAARAAAQRRTGPAAAGAATGDAGLLVERLGLPARRPRGGVLSQSFYRGDTYDFVAELSDG